MATEVKVDVGKKAEEEMGSDSEKEFKSNGAQLEEGNSRQWYYTIAPDDQY